MTYSRDRDDEQEENGHVENPPTAEEYTHLGGGAYLDEDSGEIVDQSAILPTDDDDDGNGSSGSKSG
jgi:hypothetical protein